jgi:hypothetical protein
MQDSKIGNLKKKHTIKRDGFVKIEAKHIL